MKKVKVEKVVHDGIDRIAIRFQYDKELIQIVRSMNGAKWSERMKCWHIPANEESLNAIKEVFKEGIETNMTSVDPSPTIETVENCNDNILNTNIIEFSDDDNDNENKESDSTTGGVCHSEWFDPVRFSIRSNDGMLIIKFLGRYDRDWIRELKSYGYFLYDKTRKEWILRWSQIVVDSLADYFNDRGISFEIEKYEVSKEIKGAREDCGARIRQQDISEKASHGIEKVRKYLVEKRYSNKTVESYLSQLEMFFRYFSGKLPEEITNEDITDFFNDFIVLNRYSSSYQNQMVSAIKIFYMLRGEGKANMLNLSRPRRIRALPKVFSKEEVKLILNAPVNIKHRLLLWMIYSCGLRRSEVINIKLTDLDRSRKILNIREGKGMVDRIVPVSDKVWVKIDEYLELYHPLVWLFQGQTGGKYSSESVHNVFKHALNKVGIRKEVGVHSLRHSYATHLHESGLDIRYIQELLGHRSTKTTEIYTHVSRRNLIAVKSPIEDLDLK